MERNKWHKVDTNNLRHCTRARLINTISGVNSRSPQALCNVIFYRVMTPCYFTYESICSENKWWCHCYLLRRL